MYCLCLLILTDDRLEVAKGNGSTLPPKDLAITEEQESGDGLNAILHRQLFAIVYIHLENANAIAQILLQLLQNGMHGFARTTPCGIEVDQCQLFTLDDIVEVFHNL